MVEARDGTDGKLYIRRKTTGVWGAWVADSALSGSDDKVAKVGDTMTGMLVLPATVPTLPEHATNKAYVDNASIGTINIQIFSANGTYTPTPGMLCCIIECIGGGAGGNGKDGAASTYIFGGGGGGGAYARKFASAALVGASKAVTIGAGGSGGPGTSTSAGTAGGDTSVGSICIAKGAPANGSGYIPGTGGPTAGCVGDYLAAGNSGQYGLLIVSAQGSLTGGAGGDSRVGPGARQISMDSYNDIRTGGYWERRRRWWRLYWPGWRR